MEEYIERSAAVCVANYAIDEHPYDKDPARPETFSDYNSGWNDACDYIQEKLELLPAADVAPVKHGRWVRKGANWYCTECNRGYRIICGAPAAVTFEFCPNCGCKMDGVNDGG